MIHIINILILIKDFFSKYPVFFCNEDLKENPKRILKPLIHKREDFRFVPEKLFIVKLKYSPAEQIILKRFRYIHVTSVSVEVNISIYCLAPI